MSYAADSRASQGDDKNENPGIVTSDSLAAESVQEGGSFGANSDDRGVISQGSKGSTASNTNTSGARTIDPATSRSERDAEDETSGHQSGASDLTGSQGLGSSAGGVIYSSVGSGNNTGSSGNTGSAQNTSGFNNSSSGVNENSRPKGANISEGGFDSDAPNASFTDDIGGKNDPGRAALGKMEAANEPGSGGTGPRQFGAVSNDGQFDSLGDTSA
ncbi:hypothetical protein LTR78_006686 [Recurvomyces mirabilis]|uniref:Uncharacterized protein n=1 Tax=Recurvomyces mirabilis TaxID=574656 RepID=A0AAE0WKM1_9PEZI|nr:hypothetical protein LTR78_006686 [Recurvomyces mirabilis]KAK5151425.1 hypothetical protein LTS14_009268 [Recurvomyces mirabilis]